MTQEEKELLSKDLCARLPYGVMFDYNNNEPLKVEGIVRNIVYYNGHNYQTEGDECYANITKCKPYLRPMSSMTDEEKRYFERTLDLNYASAYNEEVNCSTRMIDFFNKHHFDYRGLIKKGLALEAPEDMYKSK